MTWNSAVKPLRQLLKSAIVKAFHRALQWERQSQVDAMRRNWKLPSSVDLHHSVDLCGSVTIGEHTYINEGTRIASGENTRVTIGNFCAIGRYVHIMAYTHSPVVPTAEEERTHSIVESDIEIGNYVWIGDKAFIREGVVIGEYSIIGANSVVTKNVKRFEVVGGVPARHLRFNVDHHRYTAQSSQ